MGLTTHSLWFLDGILRDIPITCLWSLLHCYLKRLFQVTLFPNPRTTLLFPLYFTLLSSLVAQRVKSLPARWKTWVRSLRPGFDPWVRKIPWRRKWQYTSHSCLENPMDAEAWCRLWSMGSQRVGHDWVTSLSLYRLYLPSCAALACKTLHDLTQLLLQSHVHWFSMGTLHSQVAQ